MIFQFLFLFREYAKYDETIIRMMTPFFRQVIMTAIFILMSLYLRAIRCWIQPRVSVIEFFEQARSESTSGQLCLW